MTAAAVVVVDAGADLAETLSRVEDWLRWCTPRTAQGADRLDAGAAAAAAVAGVLRRSSRQVSTLDGAELAAVCVLPGDLAATLAALQAAAVEADEPGPPGGPEALAFLARCWEHAGVPETRLLAAVALATPGDRPALLDGTGLLAYRRLVAATIRDPLDAFVALPPPRGPFPSAGIGW